MAEQTSTMVIQPLERPPMHRPKLKSQGGTRSKVDYKKLEDNFDLSQNNYGRKVTKHSKSEVGKWFNVNAGHQRRMSSRQPNIMIGNITGNV